MVISSKIEIAPETAFAPLMNVVEFTEDEVVRHRLTKYFIQIFEHKDYKKIDQAKVIKTNPRLVTTKPKVSLYQSFVNFFK